MPRTQSFSGFPGRAAVLAELKRVGHWTTRDLFAWARCNGGTEPTYAALNFYVARGKLAYEANRWSLPAARPASYSVAATQNRRG